ncbi:MAG: type II toxin-antitoxin system VapC family toxin [Caulobacteraceae bacterium]
MSGFLFDTSALIWSLLGDPRFDESRRERLSSGERYVSQACGIEIAIKLSIGRLTLPAPFASDFAAAFESGANDLSADILAITLGDIGRLSRLPLFHRDPFDRLVIAQALNRGLTVITGDRAFEAYPSLEVMRI